MHPRAVKTICDIATYASFCEVSWTEICKYSSVSDQTVLTISVKPYQLLQRVGSGPNQSFTCDIGFLFIEVTPIQGHLLIMSTAWPHDNATSLACARESQWRKGHVARVSTSPLHQGQCSVQCLFAYLSQLTFIMNHVFL